MHRTGSFNPVWGASSTPQLHHISWRTGVMSKVLGAIWLHDDYGHTLGTMEWWLEINQGSEQIMKLPYQSSTPASLSIGKSGYSTREHFPGSKAHVKSSSWLSHESDGSQIKLHEQFFQTEKRLDRWRSPPELYALIFFQRILRVGKGLLVCFYFRFLKLFIYLFQLQLTFNTILC